MSTKRVIAIDGPVASGKTTVGELLSRRLGYRFLDTGTMYRGLAWLALQHAIPDSDEEALGALARSIALSPTPGGEGVMLDNKALTWELKTPEVERHASRVAEVLAVRQAMVVQQRKIARVGTIVMVGRDIGTDVLPDADLKVYLTASPQERARRRYLQMREEGRDADFDRVLQELEARDKIDSQRTHSPLHPAPDAFLMDTEGLDAEAVVEKIVAMIMPGS